jgi:cytidine deaminase
MDKYKLISLAKNAALNSYSPYSRFRVGAALVCEDGTVFTGTNVENRSFGLTVCAERAVMFSAISKGYRHFTMLAVACIDAEQAVPPCGACRQVISEFVDKDFKIFYTGKDSRIVERKISELLPDDSLHNLFQ